MDETTIRRTPVVKSLRALGYGAGAGVVASMAMAMYAMVASLVKDTGMFTPPHRTTPPR